MISKRCQVIKCRGQVLSNSMVDNKHDRYHYIGNSTDTRDQYTYMKIIPIQKIGMNTEKWCRYRGLV